MKAIKDLLFGVSIDAVSGRTSEQVSGIVHDSRKVIASSLFVAVRGLQTDGHDYIDIAISAGAKAIVCEHMPSHTVAGVVYIAVADAQEALAILASN